MAVTIDDVADWLGINQRSQPVNELLQRCLDAVVAHIGKRLGEWVPVPWPAHVEEAVLIQTARLYKRRNSPEGVAGFGDLGVVRISTLDPEVETLLSLDLAFHIGGVLPVVEEPAP